MAFAEGFCEGRGSIQGGEHPDRRSREANGLAIDHVHVMFKAFFWDRKFAFQPVVATLVGSAPTYPERRQMSAVLSLPDGNQMRLISPPEGRLNMTLPGYSVRKAAQTTAFFARKEGGEINVLKLAKLL